MNRPKKQLLELQNVQIESTSPSWRVKLQLNWTSLSKWNSRSLISIVS